jgi:hypothetical protein
VSGRGRLGFVAACLLVFGLIGVWVTRTTPSMEPPDKTPMTATVAPVAPGASRPAGLTVTDLNDVEQLQARFNAGTGMPRLVLALSPT